MPPKYDKETSDVLSDGDKLLDLVKSEGWGIAKRRLHESVLAINNILTISGKDPANIAIELSARQVAIQTILDWINDIEGSAAQHKGHKEQLENIQHSDFMLRLGQE